ncbi:MAG: glycoside hydrolase family 3 C-terminal domain-containing protein, partial [Aeriscardovia sp.]|nr:glycoside hydrolase family 3 C-terminal domain-containing protein [Aeriscardovia sp.]
MKQKGSSLALCGIFISLATAILYAVFYGKANTNMHNMSWQAFGVLLGGAAVAFILVKAAPAWASRVMALCHLVAFCLTIYQMYPYISAAMVGIDSTWEVSFFVVMALFVVGLIVNVMACIKSLPKAAGLYRLGMNLTSILLAFVLMGSVIAGENAPQINGFLKTSNYKVTIEGEGDEDTEYFKSRYDNLEALMEDGRILGEEAMAEGAVLLKNEGALPLSEGERKVSFFSISSVDPVYGGTGSGNVDVATAPTYKAAFERDDLFSVNPTLWDWYSAPEQEGYRRQVGDTGPGVKGAKVIGEAPWEAVKEANEASFAEYGDAAIVVLSRLGGEGSDMPRGELSLSKLDDVTGEGGDSTEGDYLQLSPKEKDLLLGLKEQKEAGVFKKIVVLLNFANQIETAFLEDEAYGIDAALWIGTPGQRGLYA